MSRTILITGATSSFGRELISRFPSDVRIVAVSRQPLPPEMCNESEIINVISDLAKTDFLNDFDNKVDFSQVDFALVDFSSAQIAQFKGS